MFAQSAPHVKVEVGDRLLVTIVDYKDLSGPFEVASDGTLSGPLFGIVPAAGKTLDEIQEEIIARLKRTILDPEAYVSFAAQRPKVVFLIGLSLPSATPASPSSDATAPKSPIVNGQVQLLPTTTVRSLLAGASFGDRVDKLEGLIIRSSETIHKIDIDRLLRGDRDQFDGPLLPNDVVVVRQKPMVKIWLVGPFKQPGDHLVPTDATIDQAISVSGGYDTTGQNQLDAGILNRSHLQLRRGDHSQDLTAAPGSKDLAAKVEAGDTLTLVLPRTVNVEVTGHVIRQSEVFVDSTASPLAAIAKADGVNGSGTLDGVLLLRGPEMYRLDLTPREGEKPAIANLEPNDILYVPENKRYVIVLGAVVHAGITYFPDEKRDLYAAEALSQAGGLAPNGSLLRAVLLHPDGTGKYVRTKFNLDRYLKDGDLRSNPKLAPGDVLFFDTPKGVGLVGVTQVLTTAAILNSLGIKL